MSAGLIGRTLSRKTCESLQAAEISNSTRVGVILYIHVNIGNPRNCCELIVLEESRYLVRACQRG
jgi:hypothetical protein